MTTVLIALGSNLEPRQHYLQQAVQAIHQLGSVTQVAPLYETLPYGNTHQPRFFNSALALETTLSPHPLLQQLKAIEQQLGRRHRERWGPREIDLDIIFYGQLQLHTPELTIPHPDYRNRCFVLQPLADIAPTFVPPDADQPLAELARPCAWSKDIQQIQQNWVAV